jgi:hypothetical protein
MMTDLPGARHTRSARATVRKRDRDSRRSSQRALPADTVIVANGRTVPQEEETDGDR